MTIQIYGGSQPRETTSGCKTVNIGAKRTSISSSRAVAMVSAATTARFNVVGVGPPASATTNRRSFQFDNQRAGKLWLFPSVNVSFQALPSPSNKASSSITCSATDKPTSSSSEISSAAKIRSEVLSPFRSVRMFFYLAFVASSALGGLIATTQLIGALANPSRSSEVPEILKSLAIDGGAVSLFAFLYSRENNAKRAQLARLSREESLSNLKLRVDEKRVIPVSSLRGIARLVICAGPASFVSESFKRSQPFTEKLLERGVLVVPFAMDGNLPTFEFEESEDESEIGPKRKRLWQLSPVYVAEWSKWLEEQKKLAGISPESPVYLSLRMDGRVRGSGVGYPPWNAFVAQLPPVKGMWSGLLDGMDGRVL